MKTIEDRIYKTIKDQDLIARGDTIIIGASGGPDSQFLIYILNKFKEEMGFDIVLAHLNHLHRKEAINDENLVIETAKKLDIPYFVERKSMDDYAKKLKISSEDAGRILRYDFFASLAKDYKNPKIGVAHNKDDQAETVLMRIIRGTGLDGLRAMDYKNNNIIRPILDIKKSEIMDYLEGEKISYALDKTNFETDYTRNKIRLDIIPQIEKINPNFIDSLVSLSLIAKDDLSILDKNVEETYRKLAKIKKNQVYLKKEDFDNIDDALAKRIIRRAIYDIKGHIKNFSKENIDTFLSIKDLDNGKFIVKDDLVLRKSYDYYILELASDEKKLEKVYELGEDSTINFDGIMIKSSIIDSRTYKKDKNTGYFDYDLLKFPLKVRTRRPGDRFVPLSRTSEKKVKDFFIDQKIDRKKRDQIPIILSNDQIIWLAGLRISDTFKVTERSKKILKIEVYDEN